MTRPGPPSSAPLPPVGGPMNRLSTTRREAEPPPSPASTTTAVRFRSGATAVIVQPDPATFIGAWRAALDGQQIPGELIYGNRILAVVERLSDRPGQPEVLRMIDLRAVEHVVPPTDLDGLGFPESWKATMPRLTSDDTTGG